jgi:Protein of unknown function (DUF4235)
MVLRLLFAPLSITAGIIAGLVGKKLFEFIWARIDEEEPPSPEHLDVTWPKVLLASSIEGAIFRGTRAATDRGARIVFYRATGRWPGEVERDSTEE